MSVEFKIFTMYCETQDWWRRGEWDPQVGKILDTHSKLIGERLAVEDGWLQLTEYTYKLSDRGYTLLSMYRGTDQDVLAHLAFEDPEEEHYD